MYADEGDNSNSKNGKFFFFTRLYYFIVILFQNLDAISYFSLSDFCTTDLMKPWSKSNA
jgi:hypothetical protein